jgi:hypothetical protein
MSEFRDLSSVTRRPERITFIRTDRNASHFQDDFQFGLELAAVSFARFYDVNIRRRLPGVVRRDIYENDSTGEEKTVNEIHFQRGARWNLDIVHVM